MFRDIAEACEAADGTGAMFAEMANQEQPEQSPMPRMIGPSPAARRHEKLTPEMIEKVCVHGSKQLAMISPIA